MKKIVFLLPLACFAMLQADAQTAQPAQGQPVSSSRDILVTPSPAATVGQADPAATTAPAAKDATGPAASAPAAAPATPGAAPADDKKKPK